MNRNERKEIAESHVLLMEYQYKNEIDNSIKNSKIYTDKEIKKKKINIINNSQYIQLLDLDCVSALESINKKTVILNFASYTNPGGGFLKGAIAQEESLCHESILYNVLSYFKDFYNYNNKHKNNSLYMNRAIYSPDIYFNNINKFADVITCASPNFKANGNKDINSKCLRDRINFIFNIAQDNNIDTLILGAFGCGVFGQNPREVAKIFLEEGKKTKIKNLIFAIPDKKSRNYIEFEKVILCEK